MRLIKITFLLFLICFALPVFAFPDDTPQVSANKPVSRRGFPAYKDEIMAAEQLEAEIRRRIDMSPGDKGPYYKNLNNAVKNGLDVSGDPVKFGGLSKARGFADAIDSLLKIGDTDLFSVEVSKVAKELMNLQTKKKAFEAKLDNPRTPYQEKIKIRPQLDDIHKNLSRIKAKSDAMQHLYSQLNSAKTDAALRRVIPDMVKEGRVALEKFGVKAKAVNSAVRPLRLKEWYSDNGKIGSGSNAGKVLKVIGVIGKISSVANVIDAKNKWDDMQTPYRKKCLDAWSTWNAQVQKVDVDLQATEKAIRGLQISIESPYAQFDQDFYRMVSKKLEDMFNKRAQLRAIQKKFDKPFCDPVTGSPIA